MDQTKILAIAPYEGLREVLLSEAARRSDEISLSIYVGDLSDGLSIARSLEDSGFDVILSRGGTAELLKENLSLPVIDVVPSVLDVLRFVRLARNTPCARAIVAFPAITSIAGKLFDLVGQTEDIHTIHNSDEALSIVSALKAEGCSLIVGDAIAVTTAQKLNMNAILIASGAESVQAAFSEAVKTRRLIQAIEDRNLLFRSVLDKSSLNIVVFDAQQKLVYSNLSSDQMDYPRVFRTLSDGVSNTLQNGELRILRKSKGFIWDITGRRLERKAGDLAVFYIEKKLSVPQEKNGVVEFYHMLRDNGAEDSQPIDSLGQMRGVRESAEKLGKTLSPVLVLGENGTPVESIVKTLYGSGPWKMHTLVTVDCALIDAKSFRWLLESEDSIFSTNQLNLCLENIDALAEGPRRKWIEYARGTSLHKRNHLLYCAKSAPSPDMMAFLNEINCAVLKLPPLRQRREDIPGLANLYLGALNAELGKQALGFTQEALSLMQNYGWPGNHDQLRCVVRQALLLSESEILSDVSIRSILSEEPSSGAESQSAVPLDGTLEEITARAVWAVLRQEKMNRNRTAERLAISRSTLWRMLK